MQRLTASAILVDVFVFWKSWIGFYDPGILSKIMILGALLNWNSGLQKTNSTLFWKPAESFCLRRQLRFTWWRQWFELFLRFAWLLCHVGNDELATTSTLFLLEVPPSIMEGRFDLPGTIESLLRNSESVPLVMATVGDAYHTILQQV